MLFRSALCLHVGLAAFGTIGMGTSQRYAAAGPAIETSRKLRAAAAQRRLHMLVSVEMLEHARTQPAVLAGLVIEEMEGLAGLPVTGLVSLDIVRAHLDS